MSTSSTQELIDRFAGLENLSRADRNRLLFDAYRFFVDRTDELINKPVPGTSDVVFPIDASMSPSRIIDLVAPLLWYSPRVIVLMNEALLFESIHSVDRTDVESGAYGPTYCHLRGSLPIEWALNIAQTLSTPLDAGNVDLAITTAINRWIYMDSYAGPGGFELDVTDGFMDLLTTTKAVPVISEDRRLRIQNTRTAKISSRGKRWSEPIPVVEWENIRLVRHYWLRLFHELDLPFFPQVSVEELLRIREDEYPYFDIFVSRMGRSLRRAGEIGSERAIRDAVAETMEGFVEIWEYHDRRVRRSKYLASLSVGTLSVSALTFVLPEVSEVLRAVLGSGSAAALVGQLEALSRVKAERRMHRFYVPLRLAEYIAETEPSLRR